MADELVATEYGGRSLLVDTETGEMIFKLETEDGDIQVISESEACDLYHSLPIEGNGAEGVRDYFS